MDLTAFWRLRLKGWMGKYFNGIANRMLKGIGFAVVVEVGQLAGQRLPLLRQILRSIAIRTFIRTLITHYSLLITYEQLTKLVLTD